MLLDSASFLDLISDAATAADLAFVASAQTDTGSAVTGYVNEGASNGATGVTMVAAPSASQFRRLLYVSIRNTGTVTRDARVRLVAASTRVVRDVALGPGESLEYAGRGWRVLDADGREKIVQPGASLDVGDSITVFKSGTAAEAAGSWYGFKKDAGAPGAWTPGTPGINGAAVSGPFAGALPFVNPTEQKRLSYASFSASAACQVMLYDLLWYNTDLVATTLTEQAITTPTFPARDARGTSNGHGLLIGLYWTAASTNAGAISTATVRYTNQDGTPNRTARLVAAGGSQIPATPVVGTIVWFSLDEGDTGVRSIEGITLAVSLVTGSVSLFVARPIVSTPVHAANIPGAPLASPAGVVLYPSSALFVAYLAAVTTANAVNGVIAVAAG